MALRSRLNRNRENRGDRSLPEEDGGPHRDRVPSESTEVDNSSLHDKPHTPPKDDVKSNEHERDKTKENKSDSTTGGRSVASRFRRNKKALEEKPTNEEQEPLNRDFGNNDRDKEREEDEDEKTAQQRKKQVEIESEKKGPRDSHQHNGGESLATGDASQQNQLEKDLEMGPLRVLEPIRTDPVLQLKTRHKKLERLAAEFVPEIHIVGSILSGRGIVQEQSEGASCRWKVDGGSGWEHLEGDLFGQTQVAYPGVSSRGAGVPFNHPLDLHFAEPGIQSWGSPRLMLQCYRLDVHGRRILAGYGFVHIPTTKGLHQLEVNMWRPTGTSSEEMDSSYLGRVPALLTPEPIYDSAWDERCRLVTVPAGSVLVELFIMTRFMSKHNSDLK